MALLKLPAFPESRAIPLGCYAENVSSITYRAGDETCRYRDVLIYLSDEDGQSVVRDKAGQFWPKDATDVEIEYEPRAVVAEPEPAPDIKPKSKAKSKPQAGDELAVSDDIRIEE